MKNKDKQYDVMTDCFAYRKPANQRTKYGTCNALTDLFCKIEECNFYKPKDNI